MTNEIPEIPEENLDFSKRCLHGIFLLVKELRIDLDSDDKVLKGAAMVMIHIIMNAINNNEVMKKGESNDLSDLGEEQIPRTNDPRSQQ